MKPKTKPAFFHINQELLVSLGVALLCLLASIAFPAKNSTQIITKNLFFLVLLPMAYIKIILAKNLSDFGWNLKNKKTALGWGTSTCLFTLLLFYLMFNYTQFGAGYALSAYVKNNFWLFLVYELIFVNISIFIFSYFFHAFLISLLRNTLKYWAIALQSSVFLVALFFTQTLSWQTAPFVLLSITGGFLAYQTKSFFYSYFMSFFAIIILDAYIIYILR